MSAPDPIRLQVEIDRGALEASIARHLHPRPSTSCYGSTSPIEDAIAAACRDASGHVRDAVTRAVGEVVADPGFVASIRDAYREAALERARQRARAAVDRSKANLFGTASEGGER